MPLNWILIISAIWAKNADVSKVGYANVPWVVF